jgi:HSP20 family protein
MEATDMNLEKLKPWNWFRHEDGDNGDGHRLPVVRERAAGGLPGDPASLFSLHREMDRWFDEAFKSFGFPSLDSGFVGMPAAGGEARRLYRPQIDVSADDNCYEISLDVPGLAEDDLSLELNGDVLTIKGQKEERNESKDRQYYRVERSYGSFQRTLALPDDAVADEIRAKLDKGVLRLVIPRRAGSDGNVRRISISA